MTAFLRPGHQRLLFFCLFLFLPGYVFAEPSIDELQNQALANVSRARQIVIYAQKLIEASPTRETAQRCVEIYLEAAHLYGNAARTLKGIGPSYVPQEVVDELARAERSYLKLVDEIRRLINKGEVVTNEQTTLQYLLNKLKEGYRELPQ